MNAPHRTSNFAEVNGIRLHYLDWGGSGPTICFLAGLGLSAYYYAGLAPRFSGPYRVIALTRRGHGDSDHPDSGYDVETLTEDLRQFLDLLQIQKVILAGHSLANVELCHFATLYPDRTLKLIFLEAGYDGHIEKPVEDKNPLRDVRPPQQDPLTVEDFVRQLRRARPDLDDIWGPLLDEEVLHMVAKTPEGTIADKMKPAIEQALIDTYYAYTPELASIAVPVLSIYGIFDQYRHYVPDYLTAEQRLAWVHFIDTGRVPCQRECIEQFRRSVPHARTVEIPNGHHYCFIKHEDLVFHEMNRFLSEASC